MSANTEKLVERFLRQESCNKNIQKYQLRHAAKGKTGVDVETFEITESLSVEELGNLASLIVARAQLDADGFGPNLQRYTLTSYLPEEKTSARLTFRLKGAVDLDIDDDEGGEEAPNNRGLMSQLMRHNEANNRTMVGSMGTMLNLMTRRMESQDKVIERLLDDRFRNIEIMEEALSRKHEREMEAREFEAKQERITLGFKKVAMLVPAIMDKLTGGKMPSKSDPMVLMLEEMVSSLTPDQFAHIGNSLDPNQKILFFQMLKRFQERKQLAEGSSVNGEKKEN